MTCKEKGEEADKERKATSCKKGTLPRQKGEDNRQNNTSQLQNHLREAGAVKCSILKTYKLKGQKDIHA